MVKITYLGHASILVKSDKVSFVVDPYQDNSVPGITMPRLSANYVFCSHGHHDHNAKELVKIVHTNECVNYESITVPHDHHNGEKRGLNNMYIFDVDGYRILHMGDLGCIPSADVLSKIRDVDVVFAPINGFYTISAEELVQICKVIQPKLVVPIHYYNNVNNSGYPDGGQIDTYKRLVDKYFEVNESSIILSEELLQKRVLIFNKCLQEK